MGTYLSTPVTEKTEESGESKAMAWGVVEMQGWRKNMEDAHVCAPAKEEGQDEFQDETVAVVFGVFDGHGGPEVARFCQLYLISVLKHQETWNSGQEQNRDPRALPKETSIGKALVSTFHALDRMIDDPARRDELIRLRAVKPALGERQNANSIPPPPASPPSNPSPDTNSTKEKAATDATPTSSPQTTANHSNSTSSTPANAETSASETVVVVDNHNNKSDDNKVGNDVSDDEGPRDNPEDDGDAEKEDDDSNEAVGKEEAALEQSQEEEENEEEADVQLDSTAGKVSVMFQRLLNMSTPTGQIVVQLTGQQPDNNSSNNNNSSTSAVTSPSASTPSLIRNGRLICNLPDHPIHAGATAIVAVVCGRMLTVANAGDSRAVLCRGGVAYPLSFDHKPLQDRELTRIRNAGGFVNQFGRVNGNLNLSRSIGDLKYKQVPNIPPSEQMITAEPDVVQVEIGDQDEFIILGCDGIWDCLTNEKAVAYVRSRIDTLRPTQIGVEMLNDIISEDPRATQGIGGDNMTIMIIDLQPSIRSWRQENAMQEQEPERIVPS